MNRARLLVLTAALLLAAPGVVVEIGPATVFQLLLWVGLFLYVRRRVAGRWGWW